MDISINFTFSLTKFRRKKAPEATVSSCHASLCSGKRRQWGVGRVGVCPMRSCKGNGLSKGSPNRTAALTTELTQKKDFVVVGESVKSFLSLLLPVKQLSPTWKELLMKYLYIIDTSPLLSLLIFAFDLRLWSSLHVAFNEQTTLQMQPYLKPQPIHQPGWCRLVWIIKLTHTKKAE